MRPPRGGIAIGRKIGPYRRKYNSSTSKVFAYIETRSGEYDATERGIIKDAYVDGWEWYTSGKHIMQSFKRKGMKKEDVPEFDRLFRLGYKDAKELA